MVTASQLLCGNLIHIWQTRSWKLVLIAFCPPRRSSREVGSIVHSHKLFRCYSLAAPSLQKVTESSCSNAFTVVLCPEGWSRETWACGLQNPGAPPEFLQFIYTESGFAARFEPPLPPSATLLDTQLSTISPILSHGLMRTKKLMFDSYSTQNH